MKKSLQVENIWATTPNGPDWEEECPSGRQGKRTTRIASHGECCTKPSNCRLKEKKRLFKIVSTILEVGRGYVLNLLYVPYSTHSRLQSSLIVFVLEDMESECVLPLRHSPGGETPVLWIKSAQTTQGDCVMLEWIGGIPLCMLQIPRGLNFFPNDQINCCSCFLVGQSLLQFFKILSIGQITSIELSSIIPTN